VESESILSASALVQGAENLANALPAQGFVHYRTTYLEKQVLAKEQQLYRARGYIEHSIFPVISPQLVISEGQLTPHFVPLTSLA
jgi:hypothetical protein